MVEFSADLPFLLHFDKVQGLTAIERLSLMNELKETLKAGIRSLKEKEQMVLSLYYSDELTMKEIASVLEISEPRVSQIHASAIHKLEQYLRKQMA